MPGRFLWQGPKEAYFTILLAHGAGAPMDSASMMAASTALAGAGFLVARFEFAYMAARRTSGSGKPPPRADRLMPEYAAAVAELASAGPLIIGGKSMGGRIASMVADDLSAKGKIAGLLCLGYPFHPIGKPDQLRTAHLVNLKTPTLIVQGSRDEFGQRSEVETYGMSRSIEFCWLDDGDHDLKPRKTISGFSASDHLETMAKAVKRWANDLKVQ